jgi:hypothetical protein
MRAFPACFLVFFAAISTSPLASAIESAKEPEVMAKKSAKLAAELREEAKMWEEKASKFGGSLASELKKMAKSALSESEELEKASKAWGNRQIRLASRYQKKATDYCEKRWKIFERIKEDVEKAELSEKSKAGVSEKAAHKKAGLEKNAHSGHKGSDKVTKVDESKKPADSKEAAEILREQIDQLGQ